MEQPQEQQNGKPGFLATKKGKAIFLLLFAGLGFGGVGLLYGWMHSGGGAPAGDRSVASEASHWPEHSEPQQEGILNRVRAAASSVQLKVDELARAVEENERLRLENENLRLQLGNARFECDSKAAAARTLQLSRKLNQETWQMAGRKLETIQYEVPAHLLPHQLHALGVAYLRNGEIEKSAKIFTRLTGMEDDDSFKTASNYLLTGVAWYRLDHLQLADRYFEKVIGLPDEEKNLKHQAQARLWRALVAKRTNRHKKSQEWLLDLVDHHPRSPEAGWVNSKEASRARSPAAERDARRSRH